MNYLFGFPPRLCCQTCHRVRIGLRVRMKRTDCAIQQRFDHRCQIRNRIGELDHDAGLERTIDFLRQTRASNTGRPPDLVGLCRGRQRGELEAQATTRITCRRRRGLDQPVYMVVVKTPATGTRWWLCADSFESKSGSRDCAECCRANVVQEHVLDVTKSAVGRVIRGGKDMTRFRLYAQKRVSQCVPRFSHFPLWLERQSGTGPELHRVSVGFEMKSSFILHTSNITPLHGSEFQHSVEMRVLIEPIDRLFATSHVERWVRLLGHRTEVAT